MSVVLVLLQALWFIWPAYCANAFPTVVKGKIPVDCGRFLGKSRVLGSSKTVEGTIAGVLFGIIIGSIQMNLYSTVPSSYGLFQFSFPVVILLSIGALVGDMAGSFVK